MTTLLPFTTDLIRAFGWTLLHSFWQGLLIFACLRIVLRLWPLAGASIKYHLSFISLTGIAGWFVMTFWKQLTELREVQLVERMTIQMDATSAAELLNRIPVAEMPEKSGLQLLVPGMEVYFPFLVAIYVIGVAIMTIRLGIDLTQLRQIRRQDVSNIGLMWEQRLSRLAERMGVKKHVELAISQYLQVPVMIGFLRPVILLPAAMINNLSQDQLEAILLHELAHIKRNDYLLNIFQSIVETLLFFNPFVWWISRNIRQEREHCCDDLVIAGTVQPLHYAKALVALEEYRLTANPMAMAAADDKHLLLHRIKRIMEMKTKHLNYSQRLLAVLIIMMSLVSIAWLNPASSQEKKRQRNVAPLDTVPAPPAAPAPVPPPPPATAFATFDFAGAEPAAVVHEVQVGNMLAFEPAYKVFDFASLPQLLSFSDNSATLAGEPTYTVSPDILIFPVDTLPYKIMIDDGKGNRKEYKSVEELIEADKNLKAEYLKNKKVKLTVANDSRAIIRHLEAARISRDLQQSLEGMEHGKVSKELLESLKQVDWQKMQKEIDQQVSDVRWEKISKELKGRLNKEQWEGLQKELREQLDRNEVNVLRNHSAIAVSDAFAVMNAQRGDEATINLSGVLAASPSFVYSTPANHAAVVVADQAHKNLVIQRAIADKAHKIAGNRIRIEQAQADKAAAQAFITGKKLTLADGKTIVLAKPASPITSIFVSEDNTDAANRFVSIQMPGFNNTNYQQALRMMEADQLIDRSKKFEVKRKNGELYINGKQQPEEVRKRYEQYLGHDDVSIKGNKKSLTIETPNEQ